MICDIRQEKFELVPMKFQRKFISKIHCRAQARLETEMIGSFFPIWLSRLRRPKTVLQGTSKNRTKHITANSACVTSQASSSSGSRRTWLWDRAWKKKLEPWIFYSSHMCHNNSAPPDRMSAPAWEVKKIPRCIPKYHPSCPTICHWYSNAPFSGQYDQFLKKCSWWSGRKKAMPWCIGRRFGINTHVWNATMERSSS